MSSVLAFDVRLKYTDRYSVALTVFSWSSRHSSIASMSFPSLILPCNCDREHCTMETTSKSLVSVEEVADFLEERLRCIIHLSLPDTLPLYTCLTCGSAICQECLVAYRKRGFEECPCCASDVRLLAHNRPLEGSIYITTHFSIPLSYGRPSHPRAIPF